ncbi:MAG: hypothetical protein M1283_02160 [Gammaproteobacteria bacterium]|nr:hypothetical protein [Gammaproteobacteria bacterium]
MFILNHRWLNIAALCITLVGCGGGSNNNQDTELPDTAEAADPSQIAIGERLFKETRFAQFFAVNSSGDVNATLSQGDPAVATSETVSDPLPGPAAGQTMNCAQCHLVDQQLETPGGGMRTYADFARRSPLTARSDGQNFAVRNSPPLVNSALPRDVGLLFHFDGEFTSMEQLVEDTLTGRMQGWLPGEQTQAIAQIAKVIREDSGLGALAQEFGGSYKAVLTGTDAGLSEEFRLPPEFRVDVAKASDQEILAAAVKLITAYVNNLVFGQDDQGAFSLSPYDRFLVANDLPRQPNEGESNAEYSRRLLLAINAKTSFNFIQSGSETAFQFHPGQSFKFGEQELNGLRLFLARPQAAQISANEIIQGGIGNCVACHPAPNFTDFRLHNNGAAQAEYDNIHGFGTFAALTIPDLAARSAEPGSSLPATSAHPSYAGHFRAIPTAADPRLTDLGAWNIFANPDFPDSQQTLHDLLCLVDNGEPAGCPSDTILLDRAVATFKTPGLRDLGHSAPYMHTGQFDTLEQVVSFYQTVSAQARDGRMRNADPRIGNIAINGQEVTDLAVFLKALNEDYN